MQQAEDYIKKSNDLTQLNKTLKNLQKKLLKAKRNKYIDEFILPENLGIDEDNVIVYLIDVGSINEGNLGWWRAPLNQRGFGHLDLDMCCKLIINDLKVGKKVSLGFEYSGFIPVGTDILMIGKARKDEESSWSAQFNPLGVGMQETLYVFDKLREELTDTVKPTFTLKEFKKSSNLLLWEAIITKKSKPKTMEISISHLNDCLFGVDQFKQNFQSNKLGYDVDAEECFKVIGAALLRSNLSKELKLLATKCYVVRPNHTS